MKINKVYFSFTLFLAIFLIEVKITQSLSNRTLFLITYGWYNKTLLLRSLNGLIFIFDWLSILLASTTFSSVNNFIIFRTLAFKSKITKLSPYLAQYFLGILLIHLITFTLAFGTISTFLILLLLFSTFCLSYFSYNHQIAKGICIPILLVIIRNLMPILIS
ncbi:hypothetical protein [Lactobacillus sp.]|uniref:hypothetical protein n=1 Tax=Lactobacillus sp. TaxID=1591 RepID=UPI00198EDCC9|nr:hypothetical protein [Lactobacillus sp.]MBD5429108.1 hypothetical protein [Lactobacillus sp.]MBD5430606.1 hypothetical protein [Lactobacillus sp.]